MLYLSKSKVYKDTPLAINIVQEVPWFSSQYLVELELETNVRGLDIPVQYTVLVYRGKGPEERPEVDLYIFR